jgi:predicted nucleic acid-binding protein
VLADTSVWIDFLNEENPGMASLLEQGAVDMHPFVIGELACGNLKDRPAFLARLQLIPRAPSATQDEAMYFLDANKLWGLGLSWIDLHLLLSTRLAGALLWTRDKALHKAAEKLRIAF